MSGTIDEVLGRWEWAHHEAIYSTRTWPELLALIGLAIGSCGVVLALRRPIDPRGARLSAAIGAAMTVMALALLAGGGLVARMRISDAPWPLVIAVLAGGTAAAVLLVLTLLRRASPTELAMACTGALLALAPATHAGWLAVRSYPRIEVVGSPHQHVGLSQEITGSLDVYGGVGAWRWVHPREVIDGTRAGEHVVELIAQSGGDQVRMPFTVCVGRELAPAALPLAEGNEWVYRVVATDGAWEPSDEVLRVEGRRTVGPLHLIELRNLGGRVDVYALEGELWMHGERHDEIERSPALAAPAPPETQPEELVPRSTPPFYFAPRSMHCRQLASVGSSIELPGPTRCEGQRAEGMSGGQVIAAIFTAGIALPFMRTPVHPIEAELIASRRGVDPSFELPVAVE